MTADAPCFHGDECSGTGPDCGRAYCITHQATHGPLGMTRLCRWAPCGWDHDGRHRPADSGAPPFFDAPGTGSDQS